MNYDVAISYVTEDLDRAAELNEALTTAPELKVFFALDPDTKLSVWGKNPEQQLRRIYKNSRCCVVLLSKKYFDSKWARLELRSATYALPVVVGPIPEERRKIHDIEWPEGGARKLVPNIKKKLRQLERERLEREQQRMKYLKTSLGAFVGFAATIAATAVVNKSTQARLEENTGSIDGHWVDSFGIAWQIVEEGYKIGLHGKAPNGVEISASGSRNGHSIRAEWSSPMGQGAIQAEIVLGGKLITGMASGPLGGFPFNLSR